MLRRLARRLLRDEIDERIAEARGKGFDEGHAEGENEGLMQGFEDGQREERRKVLVEIADVVKQLLQSGHMCFLPFRAQSDQPLSFVRPKEPFHLLAAEVQMSDAPVLAEPVNRALLENEPEYCERLGMSPEAIQATIDPEAWARARAIDQFLPKLARMIDAKMSDREAVPGMPGRRRYTVAVSVQQAEEL